MSTIITLLDDPVMTMWFFVGASFFLLAGVTARVWWDVRGVRGIAIITLTLSCGLLASLLGIARSPEARLPWPLILILLRPLFTLMLLSCFVIVDLWAADHNGHRSITTIAYEKFKSLTYERKHSRLHRASVQNMGG